jgi:predicted transcriptional regulator
MERSFSLEELLEILDAEFILGGDWIHGTVHSVSASDLMSDILSYSKRKGLLLTGLTNPQTVRTAEMIETVAVCFVYGKNPHDQTMDLAEKNHIPLLKTQLSMFDACGRLYCAGMKECSNAQ